MCGLASNLASYQFTAKKASIASVGPTGAAFGIFILATFFSIYKWNYARAVELLCLTPFVALESARQHLHLAPFLVLGRAKLGHVVPLAGAVGGACIVALAFRLLLLLRKGSGSGKSAPQLGDQEALNLLLLIKEQLVKRIL